jgi:F-type H+-transporting ATPase subunit delta
VTSRAVASRYARALFEVALAERIDIGQVERELSAFADLVAGPPTGDAQLARVLTNPAIPTPRKRALVDTLIARGGPLLPHVAKLLLLLAERDRLALLPDIVRSYRSRLNEHHHVVQAEVVTASPLPADRVAALAERLGRATGRRVQLESRVDPTIIGGAVTRIGSTIYDGSVTTQLRKIGEALTSAE